MVVLYLYGIFISCEYLGGRYNGKKRKIFVFLFVSILLMTLAAFVWQMFFPNMAETFSAWGMSQGWQTEIALWNVGIDMGILITLIKHNIEYAKILTLISVPILILLGGHHLIYALTTINGNNTLH